MDNIEKAAISNAKLYIPEKQTGKMRVAKASFISGVEWTLERVLFYLKDYHNDEFLGKLIVAIRHNDANGILTFLNS